MKHVLVAVILALAPVAASADQMTFEYPDDGSPWFYINNVTSTCDPMPPYGSTPLQYAEWVHANEGTIENFQVMPNDVGGHWVEFTSISSSGHRVDLDVLQPYGNCEATLDFEIQGGVFPQPPSGNN